MNQQLPLKLSFGFAIVLLLILMSWLECGPVPYFVLIAGSYYVYDKNKKNNMKSQINSLDNLPTFT